MSAYVHVVGNLGRSAELKRYDNGFVLSFSLASSDPKKNTTWFRCSMWGKRAEALERLISYRHARLSSRRADVQRMDQR